MYVEIVHLVSELEDWSWNTDPHRVPLLMLMTGGETEELPGKKHGQTTVQHVKEGSRTRFMYKQTHLAPFKSLFRTTLFRCPTLRRDKLTITSKLP